VHLAKPNPRPAAIRPVVPDLGRYRRSVTTIQQIEGTDWGDPPADGSFLIQRCHELRRKPLAQFTVEDLRIMVGQEIAVPILLPIALDILVTKPLAEGDFYAGDLLWAVLRLPASAWSAMPEQRQRLAAAAADIDLAEADLPKDVHDAVVSLVRAYT
jgi:hypothetical protein